MPNASVKIMKDDVLHVRCSSPVMRAFRRLANREGETVASITRRLVAEELRRHGETITVNASITLV